MKRLGKWLIRTVSAALIISLVIVFLPQITSLVHLLFPSGDPIVTSTLLTSKMQEVGKLTVVEYEDEHLLNARKSAVFFDAQSVTFPYTYHVALGIDLKDVSLLVDENRLIFRVPPVSVLYDELTVTGDIQKWDLFLPFTETQYQQLIASEKLKCRDAYLNDQEVMNRAWNQTVDTMKNLFGQWLKEADASLGGLELVFESLPS